MFVSYASYLYQKVYYNRLISTAFNLAKLFFRTEVPCIKHKQLFSVMKISMVVRIKSLHILRYRIHTAN